MESSRGIETEYSLINFVLGYIILSIMTDTQVTEFIAKYRSIYHNFYYNYRHQLTKSKICIDSYTCVEKKCRNRRNYCLIKSCTSYILYILGFWTRLKMP